MIGMEYKAILVICMLIFYSDWVECQRPSFGSCPKVKSATNIKIDKFLGKWYEVERSFYIYEIPTSCTTLDIQRPNNTTKELQISINTYNRWTRKPANSFGKATPKGDGSAVLDYKVKSKLPNFLAALLPGAGRYTLLATDHDTYAVVYSCSELVLLHTDLIWILGRKPDIPVWARVEAYNALTSAGFQTDHLTLSHRENCPEQ